MRIISVISILIFAIAGFPGTSRAGTCLQIENLTGQGASSNEDYEMGPERIPNSLVFCYEGERGKFNDNDGIFMRFGSNTWIWFNAIEETEVAEVWTFDFANRKALFARTRGAGTLLPSVVGAYVGDIAGAVTE